MSVPSKGRIFVILLLAVMVADIGYLLVQRARNAVRIQNDATYDRIPDVALVHPKLAPPTLTMTLPGPVTAWFVSPLYAHVSGYVEVWYRVYGAVGQKVDTLADINTLTADSQ